MNNTKKPKPNRREYKRCAVTLDDATREKASRIGAGRFGYESVSLGIRIAVKSYDESNDDSFSDLGHAMR